MLFNRTWVVARREWRTTVLRREFLLVTFGLPLIFILIDGLALVGTTMAVSKVGKPRPGVSKVVGIYDPNHVLAPDAFKQPVAGVNYEMSDLIPGQEKVIRGDYTALVVVPRELLRGERVQVFRGGAGVFDDPLSAVDIQPVKSAINAGLIWGKVSEQAQWRVSSPLSRTDLRVYLWSPKDRAFLAPNAVERGSKFIVPWVFALLLLMSILMGTGYLLHGIVEEKENRVMEVLLSSITHEELLRGKMLGLGGAGLTQMLVWALMGSVPLIFILPRMSSIPHIDPSIFVLALLMFALGFALYGSLIAGLGSLGSSWRESQQITTLVLLIPSIPLLLMPAILDSPNGPLARGLSWLPATAPIALMMRAAVEKLPAWDMALGIGLLVLGIWVVQKVSARVFRIGLLMYGKAPNLMEMLRWLRAS
jgi:ABC-2 type transport system permease protein